MGRPGIVDGAHDPAGRQDLADRQGAGAPHDNGIEPRRREGGARDECGRAGLEHLRSHEALAPRRDGVGTEGLAHPAQVEHGQRLRDRAAGGEVAGGPWWRHQPLARGRRRGEGVDRRGETDLRAPRPNRELTRSDSRPHQARLSPSPRPSRAHQRECRVCVLVWRDHVAPGATVFVRGASGPEASRRCTDTASGTVPGLNTPMSEPPPVTSSA